MIMVVQCLLYQRIEKGIYSCSAFESIIIEVEVIQHDRTLRSRSFAVFLALHSDSPLHHQVCNDSILFIDTKKGSNSLELSLLEVGQPGLEPGTSRL
jgi:hypothetical protein